MANKDLHSGSINVDCGAIEQATYESNIFKSKVNEALTAIEQHFAVLKDQEENLSGNRGDDIKEGLSSIRAKVEKMKEVTGKLSIEMDRNLGDALVAMKNKGESDATDKIKASQTALKRD